jgi:hypothetical protein
MKLCSVCNGNEAYRGDGSDDQCNHGEGISLLVANELRSNVNIEEM